MKIIALVGSSGTGKSYRAITLANEKDIDYIIDDGLLIRKNKIIAGKSAKREKNYIGAVKRALFNDENHKIAVMESIEKYNPNGILIIGTSEKMVDKIANILNIGPIDEYVYIEEIATPDEIKAARKQRHELGKHVIPVPTFEIKKDFSGYFIDPLRILRRRKDDTIQIAEKSIVRPTFSYMGKYIISDKVISELVRYAAMSVEGIHKVSEIEVNNYSNGVVIRVKLKMVYGSHVHELAKKVQRKIEEEVEGMTSLNLLSIDIVVKSLMVL